MITLETTHGIIKLELDHSGTPKTAENFVNYVKSGFYDGTIFHRIIDNFMIQGGGFEPGMQQKTTQRPIENEAAHGGSNKRGSIAMARTSDPHSATGQFFINVKDNDFLNFKDKTQQAWGYCVFGQVVEGMEVVDKIKAVATTSRMGHQDVPTEDVIIIRASVAES
jgi:peptidyl-prolyl cis-trans isomerase B (cyclophilin B)